MIKVYYCLYGDYCANVAKFDSVKEYAEWLKKYKPFLAAWGHTWDIFQKRFERSNSAILPELLNADHYRIKLIREKYLG